MNAPESIQNINIPLAKLHASKTNPRKRFDEKKLGELAESIKSQGILQPILVRTCTDPWPFPGQQSEGHFEIIAGERRYRAAKLAGLSEMPCIVRQLTDTQVLHAQVIENLQRDDLHELEEAEGYERLLKENDANGEPYTAESIGKEIGKSKAYVYGRLKLLALCEEARDAFYKGDLDASTALLIARIPVQKLQIEALKEVTRKMEYGTQNHTQGDRAMSYRRAREVLQDRYMLDLADAPWDLKDAELIPKCGSCTTCTKRTGNQPELFDDVSSKDVCTDPVCHALKKTAHVLALQKQYESQGNKLVIGKDAKKIIPNNYIQSVDDCLMDHGLVKLDAKVPGDEKGRTYAQVMKEAKLLDTKGGTPAVAKTVIENPRDTSKLIETVNIEAATKALREAGFEITLKGKASPQKADDKRAKEREKEKLELAIENTFRSRLFDTLHAQIEADMTDANSGTFPKLYRMMAVQLWDECDHYDAEDLIAMMRKYTALPNDHADVDWESHITEFGDNLPNLTPAQHLMIIIELLLITQEISVGYLHSSPKMMLKLAKELDIDADGMKKEVAAEHKVELAAAKKAATKKEAKAEQPAEPASKSVFAADPKARPKASWPFPTPDQQTTTQGA